MTRQSQVHRERVVEQAQIAANQNRARIPTHILARLDDQDDEMLEALTTDMDEPGVLRAYASWELEWRRVYDWTYTWDETVARMVKTRRS